MTTKLDWKEVYIRHYMGADGRPLVQCDFCDGVGYSIESINHLDDPCPIELITERETALKEVTYANWFDQTAKSWMQGAQDMIWLRAIEAAQALVGKFNPEDFNA